MRSYFHWEAKITELNWNWKIIQLLQGYIHNTSTADPLPEAQMLNSHYLKEKATDMSVFMLTALVNLLCFDRREKVHLILTYKIFSETV